MCKTFPAISLLQNQHSLSPSHSKILPGHACMCAPLHSPTLVYAHTHTYPFLCACIYLYTFTSPSPHTHTFRPRTVTHAHILRTHPYTLTTHTPSLTHAVTHSLNTRSHTCAHSHTHLNIYPLIRVYSHPPTPTHKLLLLHQVYPSQSPGKVATIRGLNAGVE